MSIQARNRHLVNRKAYPLKWLQSGKLCEYHSSKNTVVKDSFHLLPWVAVCKFERYLLNSIRELQKLYRIVHFTLLSKDIYGFEKFFSNYKNCSSQCSSFLLQSLNFTVKSYFVDGNSSRFPTNFPFYSHFVTFLASWKEDKKSNGRQQKMKNRLEKDDRQEIMIDIIFSLFLSLQKSCRERDSWCESIHLLFKHFLPHRWL